MARFPSVFYSLIACALGAVSASGQTAGTDVNPGAAAPAAVPPAPPSPPPPPPANRAVSPDVAAMLAVGMPKYDPPKPAPLPPPEDQTTDLRDVDKPKNDIIRLPKYMVHSERPPVFREWDLYSKDGLARLALQRYRGLSLVPFSLMNKDLAAEMYGEDERLQNMAALDATAQSMQSGGDKKESDYIKKISQDTYSRGIDWGGTVPTNEQAVSGH